MTSTAALPQSAAASGGLLQKLNTAWHDKALKLFMLIVLAHWAEHLAQAVQIYVLGWPLKESRGVLGLWYPWMVKSELLHYGYAVIMLAAIWMLRSGFRGKSAFWWSVSLWIQFWHHIEHALLQGQAVVGENLFNQPVPVSIVQLWVPRVELHLFYNSVVFIPMVIGMYYHMFPSAKDEAQHDCNCSWQPRPKAQQTAA